MNQWKILLKTGFFHIFGSSAINKIIAFLSSIVLVHILSKHEYGIFTYAWNIYSIILLSNGLGMESSLLQLCSEYNNDKEKVRSICNFATRIALEFDIILVLVLLIIGKYSPLKIEKAGILLQLMCLLPVVQLLFGLSTVSLRCQKRNKEYAYLMTINTVLVFLVSAIGAVLFREKGLILGYYIAYFTSYITGYFGMKIRLITKEKSGVLTSDTRKAVFSIALVSMCNNGLSQIMYLLDVFVLGIVVANETVLASYKVATIIPSALVFIPLSLITYLYPYFAEHRGDKEWCMKYYKKVLLGMGIINAMIVTVLLIFSPLVIRIIYGSQYADAVPIFRILAVNYFFSGTFRIISGNLLVTQRKLKFNFLVALISGTVNIIADWFFIKWWGAMGAALATVLVVAVSSIMSTSYLIHVFKQYRTDKK